MIQCSVDLPLLDQAERPTHEADELISSLPLKAVFSTVSAVFSCSTSLSVFVPVASEETLEHAERHVVSPGGGAAAEE